MPKIDVSEILLTDYIGKKLGRKDLEILLPVAKAELDDIDEENHLLKIELNDTNRPDLWSTAGLARQLKTYLTGKPHTYDFFSTAVKTMDTENRCIEVHPAMKDIRPYIAAFAVEGKPVDDVFLQALIQSQEKLCIHYGRNRKAVAMGIYRRDRIEYPVIYRGADPDHTFFCPLGSTSDMSLRQILKTHPKGIEYGQIISGNSLFPYLEDNRGFCLSLPPIINSNDCGSVMAGDKNLFIEFTGTNIHAVLTATAIMACDLADAGYRILPVKIKYPYATDYGREMVTPYSFQKPCSVDIKEVCKVLGESLSSETISVCLNKMGHHITVKKNAVSISPPPYRNDFMHGVDIIEDIMIGRGIDQFNPILPEESTIGRLSPTEKASRKIRDIMIGLGYQEMIYNYLVAKEDIIDKMGIDGGDVVEIANPKSQNHSVIRNSILPSLLNSEAVSAHGLYPHKIFEIGCVVQKETHAQNLAAKTKYYLGMLMADTSAGFNEINAHVSALLFYLNIEFSLKDIQDARFIDGRCTAIFIKNQSIGIMGELHPKILEDWHIGMPCAAAEIDIAEGV
jgi:phenylalanyl-tRNA synthetase beta chain